MSAAKKKVRESFRTAVMDRDRHACRMCSWKLNPDKLDAHHITDRNHMPAGGYVAENGIALCPRCHVFAEQFHATGKADPGYAPADLYRKIGSSYDKAYAASQRLARKMERES